MSRLVWDATGERFYETGVSNGVLYVMNSDGSYANGVVWNGLTSVNESPSGAEPTDIYADNIKYLTLYSLEEFGATVEAYTYPDEFGVCDGSAALVAGVTAYQQTRKKFGLCYKTVIGNDVDGNDKGYKIHLLYNCMAKPSERSYSTINDSPEAITFSWELTTTPVAITNGEGEHFKPTACITIDSTKFTTTAQKAALKAFEDYLYGVDASAQGATPVVAASDPRFPTPDQVRTMLTVAAG